MAAARGRAPVAPAHPEPSLAPVAGHVGHEEDADEARHGEEAREREGDGDGKDAEEALALPTPHYATSRGSRSSSSGVAYRVPVRCPMTMRRLPSHSLPSR